MSGVPHQFSVARTCDDTVAEASYSPLFGGTLPTNEFWPTVGGPPVHGGCGQLKVYPASVWLSASA